MLSYNSKNALIRGIILGIVTTVIYLAVVVITTPSLPAADAINAVFKVNSIIILGLGIGVGTQVFLSSYRKSLGCKLDKKRKGILGGGSGIQLL